MNTRAPLGVIDIRTHIFTCVFTSLFALMTGTPRADAAENTDIEAKVDAIFEAFDAPDRPGAGVAVWKDQQIVFSKGYGSANLEYGIPVAPDKTIFHVASVSKQFTVYAIMLLEAEGKLKLDDSIRDHVSEVPDLGATITLAHLATHTSGMRDQCDLLYLAGWRMDDVITVDQILKLVARQTALNFEPGAEYTYSNTGFTLLAETVARVSGMSFAQFTRQRIFQPLGMGHSMFYDDHEKIVPNRAYSYEEDEGVMEKRVLSFANAGATSLFTSAEDLVRWANYLNNPPDEESAGIVNKMNALALLNSGETFGGAYGQFVDTYKGLHQISHGGADAGYRSYLGRFPDQDFAVAVVSNYADSGPSVLALQVAEVFLGDQMTQPEASAATPTILLEDAALQAFEGYYWLEEDKTYRQILLKDGELVYSRPGGADDRLAPISENEFKMPDGASEVSVRFAVENGQRVMIFADPTGPPTVMREFDYVEPTAATLNRYTGTYYSLELDTSYILLVDGGKLIARHNRHKDSVFTFLQTDIFASDWGSVQFTADAYERINGMEVTTGRVRNLVFEKRGL